MASIKVARPQGDRLHFMLTWFNSFWNFILTLNIIYDIHFFFFAVRGTMTIMPIGLGPVTEHTRETFDGLMVLLLHIPVSK